MRVGNGARRRLRAVGTHLDGAELARPLAQVSVAPAAHHASTGGTEAWAPAALGARLRALFGSGARSEGPLAVGGAGMRYHGVDLRRPLSEAQVAFLLDSLAQFRILCLAGQDLESFSLARFERFANHWG
jgi:hypothetical protein